LKVLIQARAPMRALVSVAAFGALVVLAMGGAYLGGAVAKSADVAGKAERLAGAADSGYSNSALIEASGVDASALAIARRHDPYSVAGGAERDRQAAQFAARLDRRQEASQSSLAAGLRNVSLTATNSSIAAPFQIGGALDDSRDLDCLAQAVYYEARGEGVAGMQAVAQVVLNRVRHPAFPKTVCAVVLQGAGRKSGCQFSFACDGSLHRSRQAEAWRRSRDVAAKALSGFVMPEVGMATHFHTTSVSPGWRANLLRVSQIGSHVFYRFGGRRGALQPYSGRHAPDMDTVRPVIAGFVPSLGGGDSKPAYKVLASAEIPAPIVAEPAKPAAEPVVAKVEDSKAPEAASAPEVKPAT
jgi:spore germination cell wall hydrolase CwlJ-like protein